MDDANSKVITYYCGYVLLRIAYEERTKFFVFLESILRVYLSFDSLRNNTLPEFRNLYRNLYRTIYDDKGFRVNRNLVGWTDGLRTKTKGKRKKENE